MNQFNGGMLAGEHLIELGHKRIAYLNGPRGHSNFTGRAKGFMKAMMSSKQKITSLIMHGAPGFEGGYQMARKLLAQNRGITAIFAANDVTAFGVARAVFEAGLSIPEDISLIGFDNVELANVDRPR